MRRLALALIVAVVLPAAVARADGDPGSDVLVYQNLFVGPDAGVSVANQLELGRRLDAAAAAGVPVRVAIIARADDLGAVTALWRKPALYARYLGQELSVAYRGRLLVVMPDGIGAYWAGHRLAAPRLSVARGLVAAADAAIDRVVVASGARRGPPASSTAPAPGGPAVTPGAAGAQQGTGGSDPGVIVVGALGVGLLLIAGGRRRRDRPGAALLGGAIGAGAVAVVLAASGTATSTAGGTLETNPNLDPGTPIVGRSAPPFTLTDQDGRTVSLRQYRGKVVILDFNDAECTTICPLTTTALLDAKRALGRAGDRVQLLGVDANPRSISVEDVRSYTELHGMGRAWRFLTGSPAALERVWKAYGIYHAVESGGIVDHTPATWVIDTHGQLARLFLTHQAYSAVGQLGQLLAQTAAALLPGHPRVRAELGYGEIRGIDPATSAELPRSGGGTVAVGPGHGARLYVFFATWDREVGGLAAQLAALRRYGGSGLPPVTLVDEASVEPGPQALPAFLRSLPVPLRSPVALDVAGRLADGYEVQGQPWFTLVRADGSVAWHLDGYANGWPSVGSLESQVRAALARARPEPTSSAAVTRALAGSPVALAGLHAQGSRLLGLQAALDARVRALHGYPVVLNVWASWCGPCVAEFGLFERAAVRFGKRIAFLGADNNDQPGAASSFLAHHYVPYPSYQTTSQTIQSLLPQGIFATPTTVFLDAAGHITHVTVSPYESEGSLAADVSRYAR